MERTEILRRAKAALQEAFGDRLRGVILYGSEARGTAEPDSDVDLLVLLSDRPTWEDATRSIRAVRPIFYETWRPIHCFEVNEAEYEGQEWPLYRVVKEEGIRL